MAVLTLTPSRFASTADFNVGDYAFVFADRPVRKLGVLITPQPLNKNVLTDGEVVSFDLVPNSEIDEAKPFKYTVAAYRADGQRIYTVSIVMPDTDVNLFDLVPVTQDLDSCLPTTLTDNSV